MCNKKIWSQSLRKQTSDLLSLEVSFPTGEVIHLKHSSGKYGELYWVDLLDNNLIIRIKDSDEVKVFSSKDELLSSDWVID